MWNFIRKVLQYAWRYGRAALNKVVGWVRRNWGQIKKWLDGGLSVTAIIELVLRLLGIG